MAFSKPVIVAIFLFILLDKNAESIETPSSNSNDDTASIPMIASGKRQHNIMRFGKRPAGGHNLLRFGKRDDSRPQHSFLYFGKRVNDGTSFPDLFQYLQNKNDNSYKRGHTIMRFGKRSPIDSSFVTLGREDGENDYNEYYPDDGDIDEIKRQGHNMMYFGKRGGHSMLYFGKRTGGHNILSFGKRDDDKRAHSMIHFGKRDYDDGEDLSPEEKRAHSMIHFGKRESDDDYDDPELEMKRAAHSMIHFGKRDFDSELLPYWNPNTFEKKQHNLLRFGKKMDGLRKGSHAMIHFGKRDDDKRAHSMIHFGKRSVDQHIDSSSNNQSGNGPAQPVSRVKRDIEEPVKTDEPLVMYGNNEDEDMAPDEDLENAIRVYQPNLYHVNDLMNRISYPDEEPALISFYPNYQPVHKKEASKNVFLRFG